MSSLLDLPEEILIIIIKQLDIKSVYNLYKSCGMFKNIILMQGVIRTCNLSCNTLSTQKSLKIDMIKSISRHLYELNLCGVPDLKKGGLLPALKRMKCLKTLDVSFTEISLTDMVEIHSKCPTIQNIAINFPETVPLPTKLIKQCQKIFENFINVHFILNIRSVNLPLNIVKNAPLDTLRLTMCDNGRRFLDEQIDVSCSFKHFCLYIVNDDHSNLSQGTWRKLTPPVDMQNIEYIIIQFNVIYSLCVSPMFTKFFTETYKIIRFFRFDEDRHLYGTVAIFIWDKKSTVFDDNFFFNLKRRLNIILACDITVTIEQTMPFSSDIINYEMFHLNQMQTFKYITADTEPNLNKTRFVSSDQALNYDQMFSEHKTILVSLHFPDSVNVTLSPRYNYLSKITYLSLIGSYTRYSNEFFNILFRCCNKLTTLNVEASSLFPCYSSVIRSLPLTRTVKNLRLLDKRIDCKTVFSALSQCRTLENICIIDTSNDLNELADFAILYQCPNLYTLQISAAITKSVITKMNAVIKNLHKSYPDHYINFDLRQYDQFDVLQYKPHLEAYYYNPIKPV